MEGEENDDRERQVEKDERQHRDDEGDGAPLGDAHETNRIRLRRSERSRSSGQRSNR